MTINVSNQPPTVQSASYTLPAVATTIAAASGVLATATDPFGYPLTAVEDTGPSYAHAQQRRQLHLYSDRGGPLQR